MSRLSPLLWTPDSGFKQKPLNAPLRVNWNHPYTRGLIGLFIPQPGPVANFRNLVQPLDNLAIGSAVSYVTANGKYAVTASSNTGQTGQIVASSNTNLNIPAGQGVTVACRMRQPGTSDIGQLGFSKDTNGIFDPAWTFFMRQPYGFTFSVWNSGGTNADPGFFGGGVISGQWNDIAGVYDGANVKLYSKGAVVGSSAALTGNVRSGTGTFIIGGLYPGDSSFINGEIEWIGIWARAVSPAELKALSVDPWVLVRQPRAFIGKPMGAAETGSQGTATGTSTATGVAVNIQRCVGTAVGTSQGSYVDVPYDVWSEITPADWDPDVAGGDNFGFSGYPVVNPADNSYVYLFADYNGMWRSTNFGQPGSFTKVTGANTLLGSGKTWAARIAPDGSALYVAMGAGTNRFRIAKSTDGPNFNTWAMVPAADLPFEMYGLDIDPADPLSQVATSHDNDHVYVTTNGWVSYTDLGSVASISQYAYFGLTANTIIVVADGDSAGGNGIFRATKSGGTWSSFTGITTGRHWHGSHQLWVDRVANIIVCPTGVGTKVSYDDGASWSTSTSYTGSGAIATDRIMYIGDSYASSGASLNDLKTAPYPALTPWTLKADTAGMDNGTRAMAKAWTGSNWILFSTNWKEGVWRLVESPPIVGTSTSTSVATGVPVNVQRCIGTATGTSTVTATSAFPGTAAGTSSVTGVSVNLQQSPGIATGTSTGAGTAISLNVSQGSAAGTSSATAVAVNIQRAVGTAIGSSSVVGSSDGTVTEQYAGTSAGTSSVTGIAVNLQRTTGSAASVSSAVATPVNIQRAIGISASTGTGSGVSGDTGFASSFSTSTALGIGIQLQRSVGLAVGTSTVIAVPEGGDVPDIASVIFRMPRDKRLFSVQIDDY